MVKNIIIGALTIGLIFMTVFANLKAVEAEEQKQAATLSEQEAMRQATLARAAEAEAFRQMELAEQQMMLAQEALEKCKNK